MARRKFTREFKVSAVKLVNEQGYTIAAAGKSLGVDPNNRKRLHSSLGYMSPEQFQASLN